MLWAVLSVVTRPGQWNCVRRHVERVNLYKGVTLDIRFLRKYNGQGKCKRVECYFDTANRYKEQLRTWATSKNWGVSSGSDFAVERKLENKNTTEQLNIIQYLRNLIVTNFDGCACPTDSDWSDSEDEDYMKIAQHHLQSLTFETR